MLYFTWTLLSLVAYIAGVIMLVMATPRLVRTSFEDVVFMGFAALEILGALLVFGAVAVTFGVFSGALGIRILDFILLIGIIILGLRGALLCFRPSFVRSTVPVSRVVTGIFSVCLALAALYYVIQLFIA